jgi:hypothetical protein
MGQGLTIQKNLHVSLSDYEEIANDKYTVMRTSGQLDEGWVISIESGLVDISGSSATKHFTKDDPPKWRIFMDNSKTAHEYTCGWRRIETIYPTRLSGDEDAIKTWRQGLLEILEALEAKRSETKEADKAEEADPK